MHIIFKLALLLFTLIACAAKPGHSPQSPDEAAARDDPGPGVEVDYRAGRVKRRDPSGRLLWTVKLGAPLLGHREPHVLHDEHCIYLTDQDGITALDARTGRAVWHAKGPGDRLYRSGDLLLAVDCNCGAETVRSGRWLVGRAAATGVERFKVSLPPVGFDPWPIRRVAGLFLVQAPDGIDTHGGAILIDRRGKGLYHFPRVVLDGKRLGKDCAFLTTRNIVRVSADGKGVWSIPLGRVDSLTEGGLLTAGADLLAYRYNSISDSGVELLRLDPRTGKKVWQVRCAPLGVSHSKYRHRATVLVEGGRVRVTSRGSGGTFVETLELKTGRQLQREKGGRGE
jgi:outer membrane protein assembly factor BamB